MSNLLWPEVNICEIMSINSVLDYKNSGNKM